MVETTIEPFLRNAWYVCAWKEELDKGFVTRTIMNEPLVIFRDAQGRAGAVEDRCCHRGAPLSSGKVVDKGIECGYHGLVFDVYGKCVEIPGQENIPQAAKARAYKVVEKQGFVWIWMGDPASADESQLVDYPYHDRPKEWPSVKSVMDIKCNYMMMIDNLMDLNHLQYVHTKTIGGSPRAVSELNARRTEHGAHFVRWTMDTNPPPTYVKAVGFQGKIDRWQDFEYVVPGNVLQWAGAVDVGKGARENREQPGFHVRIFHAITPRTERECYYFWSAMNGYQQDNPEATQILKNELVPTFLEDIGILELQQARVEQEPDRPLVAIRADAALMHARRAMRDAIAAEQAAMKQAAE